MLDRMWGGVERGAGHEPDQEPADRLPGCRESAPSRYAKPINGQSSRCGYNRLCCRRDGRGTRVTHAGSGERQTKQRDKLMYSSLRSYTVILLFIPLCTPQVK